MGRLTLGELAALEECYRARMHREDWRAALIVCTLANLHRGKDDKILQPEDILPWLREKRPAEPRQTPQQMRALLEDLTRQMGGIVHPRHEPLSGK